MMILAGFGAWAFCAVACLTFFALVARRGQLEDQLAMQLVADCAPAQETIRHALPAQVVGGALQPRAALDDRLTSEQAAAV